MPKASLLDRITAAFSGASDELASLRHQIEVLREQRARVETAPLSASETRQRIHKLLDAERQDFERRLAYGLSAAARPGARIADVDLLTLTCRSERDPDAGVTKQRADLAGLITFLMGDELRSRLDPVIDALADGGISSSERSERIAEIDAKIHAAETREEELIDEAERAGMQIARRADADPAVVLEVQA